MSIKWPTFLIIYPMHLKNVIAFSTFVHNFIENLLYFKAVYKAKEIVLYNFENRIVLYNFYMDILD